MEPTVPFIDLSVWFVVKIFISFAILLYVIFSLVIIRQVNLMTDTLEVGFEAPIRLIAVAHFILAVAVFILALIIL